MSSTVKLILGFSILATSVGCGASSSSGGSAGSGPQLTAGTQGIAGNPGNPAAGAPPVGSGGTNSGGATGSAGGGTLPEGVPLTPMEGWVDAMSNDLGIQGAVFMYGDPTSLAAGTPGAMVGDFMGAKACIKGTAAKVDTLSPVCVNKTFTAPATDCYGEYWGAALGMNLNQVIDMTLTPPMGGPAMPFKASAIKGFAFELGGNVVPTQIRFKVEDAKGEYCNTAKFPVKAGANTFMLSDLIAACYAPAVGARTGAEAAADPAGRMHPAPRNR